MSFGLNALQGGSIGIIQGHTIGVTKGDARSSDYGSDVVRM